MDMIFENAVIKSEVSAISSKSEAHRALICAALSDGETVINCTDTNADINATANCLVSLGAQIQRNSGVFRITPIQQLQKEQVLDCNESGSTLRFLLPLCSSLGANCSFVMHGRLKDRPLSPLYEILKENGVDISPQGQNPLQISGKLSAGNYTIAANVSSQYISGLLFALSIADGHSKLTLDGKVESAPYIEMTVDALKAFGAELSFDRDENCFFITGKKKLQSPGKISIGGDWSNAAFFLSAGAIGKRSVTIHGLDTSSRQGDRAILSLLKNMGADVRQSHRKITVFPSCLHGITIDASQIPDLVPILATVASVAQGETVIYNAGRLRLKESDRIESVCHFLSALGADIRPAEDGMIIHGKAQLNGGVVDSFNDHRIAMSAAIASLVCRTPVKITDFEAINKSYPTFPENFE